jgi:pimeloyl-ACP methyl ester carboxylesterase
MSLHHRIAGAGPPIMLIHGAGEDTGMLTPQAEAFAARGWRVIWADRRGTGASPRDNWPGGGVAGHADDAAALLRDLEATPATVLGFSSGGVVALALAARHPGLVREAVAWEPAALGVLPDADSLHAGIMTPIEAYLAEHPDDWTGAYRVMLDVLSQGRADHDAPAVRAMRRNAEAALRDDARIITRHRFAEGELPADRVLIAIGADPDPLHAAIAERLTASLGRPPLVVADADHEVYLHRPGTLADALSARLVDRW